MYKDPDKQREANRQAKAKQRARDNEPRGYDDYGMTGQGMTQTKRGKDIKTFEDLPPDVQATINRLSESNEEKAKRTAIAIHYQHLFPDRFYSTGVAV